MHQESPHVDCSPSEGKGRRLYHYLNENLDVQSHLFEAQLFLLSLAIGIQDAIAFPDFHCFASNQTGNTVLFAVGAFRLASEVSFDGQVKQLISLPTIAVSLGFFSLGVLLSGQIANWLNVWYKRWWLLGSSTCQTVLVIVAAILQLLFDNARTTGTAMGYVVMGLLAFSSGMQVGMVRALRVSDITTAMATAAYIDVFIDPKLFAAISKNRGRNRRVVFLLSLVVGSFIGAALARAVNSGVALLVSAILKAITMFSLLLNGAQKVSGDVESS